MSRDKSHRGAANYIPTKRERTRSKVIFILLAILGLTVIGIFILLWWGKNADAIIEKVLPLLTTLIGSALGFYFGGEGERDEDEDKDTGTTEVQPDKNPTLPPDQQKTGATSGQVISNP